MTLAPARATVRRARRKSSDIAYFWALFGAVPESPGFSPSAEGPSRNRWISPVAGDGRPKNGDLPRLRRGCVRESGAFPAAAAARGGNPAGSWTGGREGWRFRDASFSPGEKPGDSGTALAHPRGNPPIPGRTRPAGGEHPGFRDGSAPGAGNPADSGTPVRQKRATTQPAPVPKRSSAQRTSRGNGGGRPRATGSNYSSSNAPVYSW